MIFDVVSLYDLNLHETLTVSEDPTVIVRRVPGGWIYERIEKTNNSSTVIGAVFVPYDNEFQENVKFGNSLPTC